MPNRDRDQEKNRDDQMKPGDPPRPATHPDGSERSTRNPKTLTDPATGEPLPGKPKPAGADVDETPAQQD